MANGDAPAATPDVPHFDTRFLVQTPDGSTATQVLRTDRPISTPELVAHLADQGSTFIGYPDQAPAPGAATPSDGGAPSPAPAPTAPAPPSTWAQRARGVYLPERSFPSQVPSIAGATLGATAGGFTGPFAPVASPLLAGAGSALGEAADIGYEKVTGSAPAEAAPAWDRIQNAAIRGATFEGIAQPVAWAARPVLRAVTPIAEAVGDLLPVLRQDLPASVQAVENTATGLGRNINTLLNQTPENLSKVLTHPSLTLSEDGQQTLFRAWWQRQAGNAPEKIADAWEGLTGSAQLRLAGPQRESMQTVINTLKTGQDLPALKTALYGGGPSVVGTAATAFGHPVAGAMVAAPGLVKAAGEATPYVASRMLQTPAGAQTLSWLPRTAQVAAPLSRLGIQSAGTLEWPLATTLEQ